MPVLVVTGDGELLMGLGGLATIAAQNPGNLTIAVLDNEALRRDRRPEEPYRAMRTDLAAAARGCGILTIRAIIAMKDDLRSFAGRIHRLGESSAVGVIKISIKQKRRVFCPRAMAAF